MKKYSIGEPLMFLDIPSLYLYLLMYQQNHQQVYVSHAPPPYTEVETPTGPSMQPTGSSQRMIITNQPHMVVTAPVYNQQVVMQQQQIVAHLPAGTMRPELEETNAFRDLVRKYEIGNTMALKIRQLNGFEIVIIADDSGSMDNEIKSDEAQKDAASAPIKTRWGELKTTVAMVAEMASLMDPSGVDVYFLNRAPVMNVKSYSQVEKAFIPGPRGFTPIVPILQRVLEDKKDVIKEKKLLIILATDGIPSDNKGDDDTKGLEMFLKRMKTTYAQLGTRTFISILACTDEENVMKVLNKWDDEIKGVDVVDDYQSERAEVEKAQRSKGLPVKFTKGDYLVKALLGSIDPEIDKMDACKTSCCVIC